jgi:hypothetical protein
MCRVVYSIPLSIFVMIEVSEVIETTMGGVVQSHIASKLRSVVALVVLYDDVVDVAAAHDLAETTDVVERRRSLNCSPYR